ncbi:MAG: Gfo/Idh/MocA family oxidoreductase [Clostridia bacterium]|nr:Gfo/Idh/MocA family oxidoreductase [Clostridia bacterium]
MIQGTKVRLGIIGIGNMGSEHCRLILGGACPETELCAVADLRQERREWARGNLPENVSIYTDGRELIASGRCDAVLIAVPHFQHEPLAVAALEAGLHVLCEKPAAVQADRAEKMIRAAEKARKTLTFMFNQRTNCMYRAVKELLDSGEMGAMKRMNWIITDWYRTQRYYDSGSWRATWAGEGGGVLLNQCPHQLDLLIWLCGMPCAVTARCLEGKWHHIEVEDDVTAFLEFPEGATGVFVASTGDLPGTNRLEIDCERGKIVCENGQVKVWRLGANEREICFSSDDPWYREEIRESLLETDGENPQHAGVINAFAAHLLRGEKPVAGAEDGLRALQLSNAIHLSGWTGGRVGIPVSPEAFNRELERRIAASGTHKTEDITYDTDHSRSGRRMH